MDWNGDVIVDEFRGAAMGMTRWIDALDALARSHDGRFGQMTIWGEDGGALLNLVSGTSPEEDALYVRHGGLDPASNPRTHAFLQATSPFNCITDEDFATPAALRRTAIYADVFDPLDVPHVAMVRLDTAAQPLMGVAVLRPSSRGPVEPIERRRIGAVGPAIGACLQASVRMGTLQNDMLVRTAEQLAGPAILLGRDRAIRSLSPSGEEVVRRGEHLSTRRRAVGRVDSSRRGRPGRRLPPRLHRTGSSRRRLGGLAVAIIGQAARRRSVAAADRDGGSAQPRRRAAHRPHASRSPKRAGAAAHGVRSDRGRGGRGDTAH